MDTSFFWALIVMLLVFIIVRLKLEARRTHAAHELEARRTRALMDELREEVRYDIPPARRATIEGSILAVLRGAGAGEAEAGVAFFVSPTTAITVAHNLGVAGVASSRRRRA